MLILYKTLINTYYLSLNPRFQHNPHLNTMLCFMENNNQIDIHIKFGF